MTHEEILSMLGDLYFVFYFKIMVMFYKAYPNTFRFPVLDKV